MTTTRWSSRSLHLSGAFVLMLGALAVTIRGDAAMAAQDTPDAVVDVAIGDHYFNPAQLTVPVGTTVRWTNYGASSHTSTSDTGLWNSGTLSRGGTFSYTFSSTGTFAYHCTFHREMGMVGRVVVTDTSAPTPTPGPGSVGNLARGRPVYASSAQPGYPPRLAADGNTGTFWASGASGGANSQWLYVDLGTVRAAQRFHVLWNAANRPREYGLYVYSPLCGGWCQLAWIRTGDGDDTLQLNRAVNGRYFLLFMQRPISVSGVYALREFEIFGATTSPPPSGTTNVALGRPARASSAQIGAESSRATDGSLSTSWRSAGLAAWLYVDFGQSMAVDRATLRWVDGLHASRYALYAWSGSGWYPVYSRTANASATNDASFQPIVTRFLLVYAMTGPAGFVGLREFEVYGFESGAFIADVAEGSEWETLLDAREPNVVPEGVEQDAAPFELEGSAGFGKLVEPGALDLEGSAPDGLPDVSGEHH